MDKLEFEDFDLSPEEKAPKNNEDNEQSLSEKEAIDLSNKIIGALKDKVKDHNKDYPRSKVNLDQLKKVYVRGAKMREDNEESNGAWAMARVNMFLRMKTGNVLFAEEKTDLTVKVSNFVDISASWTPSEQDFNLAHEDIKSYELYEFENIEHLYLEEYKKVEYNWGW